MRLACICAILVAAPVWAETDPESGVSFDKEIVPSCLAKVARERTPEDLVGDKERACISTAANACMAAEGGSTTVGMVNCLAAETEQWDKLLNEQYKSALKAVEAADADLAAAGSAAPPAAPTLKAAQRAWITYRDESCKFESIRYQGGTLGGPASASCMLELTAHQALRLMQLDWSLK